MAQSESLNREYPVAPLLAVGVIVVRDSELLLIRRGREPAYGKWSIPGGLVHVGESLREAAQREAYEETGLLVEPDEVVWVGDRIERDAAGRVRYHYAIVDFIARYRSGEVRCGDDAMEARWVQREDMAGLDTTTALPEVLERVFDRLNADR